MANKKKNGAQEREPIDGEHPVKIVRITRSLRCLLSDEEKAQRAERAAHLVARIESMRDEAKAEAGQRKAQIQQAEADLKAVSGEYRNGAVFRDVECEERFIYRLGKVETVRMDWEELIGERPMSEFERQTDLGFDAVGEEIDAANEEGKDDDVAQPAKKARKKRAPAGAEAHP